MYKSASNAAISFATSQVFVYNYNVNVSITMSSSVNKFLISMAGCSTVITPVDSASDQNESSIHRVWMKKPHLVSLWFNDIVLVLCEYWKFRTKSNSYFSIRFYSKQAQLFEIFDYLPSPISYLFNRMMPIFLP